MLVVTDAWFGAFFCQLVMKARRSERVCARIRKNMRWVFFRRGMGASDGPITSMCAQRGMDLLCCSAHVVSFFLSLLCK